jgi:hypothetical protein
MFVDDLSDIIRRSSTLLSFALRHTLGWRNGLADRGLARLAQLTHVCLLRNVLGRQLISQRRDGSLGRRSVRTPPPVAAPHLQIASGALLLLRCDVVCALGASHKTPSMQLQPRRQQGADMTDSETHPQLLQDLSLQ